MNCVQAAWMQHARSFSVVQMFVGTRKLTSWEQSVHDAQKRSTIIIIIIIIIIIHFIAWILLVVPAPKSGPIISSLILQYFYFIVGNTAKPV
jgi:hypothetical protein